MLYMFSGNVKENRMKDYQAWLKKNDAGFQKSAPPGWTYRGTHAYVLGFGRYHVAVLWECSKYGDFDAWREHDDESWNRLIEESSDFFTSEPGEAVLMREMSDTRILEPKKSEP